MILCLELFECFRMKLIAFFLKKNDIDHHVQVKIGNVVVKIIPPINLELVPRSLIPEDTQV